jgi:hypothetical protein
MNSLVRQRADLTFKHNLKLGRHGWLRLTPAYSVRLVEGILNRVTTPRHVLDPFSGTGTTGVTCAERDLTCDLIELNPFSVWLAKAKTHAYTVDELTAAHELTFAAATKARHAVTSDNLWVPAIHNIDRWWSPDRLTTLARIFNNIQSDNGDIYSPSTSLALVAFCRVALDWSNASFNHQSMSFKNEHPTLFTEREPDLMIDSFLAYARQLIDTAKTPIANKVSVLTGDSRCIHTIAPGPYDCVITSPPYPNRMSYIRELRPYMYWLGFLKEAREAGDLDWEAIGGTWGIATSRLSQWKPNGLTIEHDGFEPMLENIQLRSPLLANYVRKYFHDIAHHLKNLLKVVAPGAKLFYVVGNSKFYDTVIPVEEIYVSLMRQFGYTNVRHEKLRKRNSKKELFEFIVSAERS